MRKPTNFDVLLILLMCILILPKLNYWGEKVLFIELISEGMFNASFAIITGLLATIVTQKVLSN
jgi:hypothetical protein